jgi:hypothetical protein
MSGTAAPKLTCHSLFCTACGQPPPGVVKLRRGLTARVFEETHTMADLYRWYLYFLRQLQVKADTQVASHDPTVDQLQQVRGRQQQAAAGAAATAAAGAASGRRMCHGT